MAQTCTIHEWEDAQTYQNLNVRRKLLCIPPSLHLQTPTNHQNDLKKCTPNLIEKRSHALHCYIALHNRTRVGATFLQHSFREKSNCKKAMALWNSKQTLSTTLEKPAVVHTGWNGSTHDMSLPEVGARLPGLGLWEASQTLASV
jgi:hypothetical protein